MDVDTNLRRLKRCDATKTCNTVNLNISSYTIPVARQKILHLNDLLGELKELDASILSAMFEDSKDAAATETATAAEYDHAMSYKHKIIECISSLETHIADLQNAASSTANISPPIMQTPGRPNKFNLPQIPLPKFANLPTEDLTSFFKNFEDIIDKFNLSDTEKFWYLKEQLSGDPRTVINGLSATNYTAAKDLLTKAFASKSTQQFNALTSLQKLKFKLGDDPYQFISDFKQIIQSCRNLNIDLDCVLQYHIWTAMNQTMQNHLINISNQNKPTLAEIEANIFEATERYLVTQKTSKSNKNHAQSFDDVSSAEANAAAVQYKTKDKVTYCSLCSTKEKQDTSHITMDCKKYPDVQSKLDKIKQANGCTKCASLYHLSKFCKHKFYRKCRCGWYHYSFLCSGSSSKPNNYGKSKSNEKKDSVSAKSVDTHQNTQETVETGSIYVGGIKLEDYGRDAIIPTFSVNLPSGGVIRGMRDSGCQPNFIVESVAKKLNLKIVQRNFPLKVNGFISSESSKYDVVEVPISSKYPPVRAICIPKVKTDLELPGLKKLVSKYVSKGYKFADMFLMVGEEDRIANLDFILGNQDAHTLPARDILFGSNPPSVYSDTPLGICLMGSVRRHFSNFATLPMAKSNISVTKEKATNQKSLGNKKSKGLKAIAARDVNPRSKEAVSSINGEKLSSLNNSNVCVSSLDMEDISKSYELHSMHVAIDASGLVDDQFLDHATNEMIRCSDFHNLSYDNTIYNDSSREIDQEITNFVLDNTYRDDQGSLVMPLLWNEKVDHMLGQNINLSRSVLNSNIKRLQKDPHKLALYDEVIKTQAKDGIIEKIPDLTNYLKTHPNSSFLSHMGVFRMNRETTKCRVVMLSNLCQKEKNSTSISHNQAMLSGPNLNRKISTALTKLRFGEHIYCVDVQRAFNSIRLRDIDSEKLLFHWVEDINDENSEIIGYKFLKLPFGLRCSPSLMLLCLYKILILDTEQNDELTQIKKVLYDLAYMDNLFYCSDDEPIMKIDDILREIFEPYGLYLQQYYTSIPKLQEKFDEKFEQKTEDKIKILGMQYDRLQDNLSTVKLMLDAEARTKRQILSSIASNYDVLQINGPLLNRARLFAHKLQCISVSEIGWDDPLSEITLKEWRLICKQVNKNPGMSICRSVGARTSRYSLLCFGDASRDLIGCVLYIKNLDTGKVNFLQSRNKIVGQNLQGKSIPSLEMHALSYSVETIIDIYNELTGTSSVVPINITDLFCFSDSMCALNWVNNSVNKLAKMQKQSPFVMNRLSAIEKLCEIKPINFRFIAGFENPADPVTREISYKQLKNTCYLTGPSFIGRDDFAECQEFSFTVPNPLAQVKSEQLECTQAEIASQAHSISSTVVPLNRYSTLNTHIRVISNVMKCIHNWKSKVRKSNPNCFPDHDEVQIPDHWNNAFLYVLKMDQASHFPEILQYFSLNQKSKTKLPSLIGQLNIFQDEDGILRVRTKFREWKANASKKFPILLGKSSVLTNLIIRRLHFSSSHSGTYSLLSELRQYYYIPHVFSVVKRVIKSCKYCIRMNCRTINLNQSSYREFRSDPPEIPFRYIFIDHFGWYYVKIEGKKQKVWILCITCLWSRAINLKICYDMTTKEFLRNMQLHILDHGTPQKVFSDSGVQLTSGGRVIADMFKDHESQKFFEEKGMQPPEFIHYPKGNHALGSLVETAVKLCRKLIGSSVRNYVLNILEFEVAIAQAIHQVNKRPIAFKTALRDCSVKNEVPEAITPELLLKGYSTTSVNVLPVTDREEWQPESNTVSKINESYEKLTQIREKMKDIYHKEFIGTLLNQSDDKKNRYSPVSHKNLKPGNIVLLKEDLTKAINYPMAIVTKTNVNSLGEVTDVEVRKGMTRELVKRHVSSVIPFHGSQDSPVSHDPSKSQDSSVNHDLSKSQDSSVNHDLSKSQDKSVYGRPKRKAAALSRAKTIAMLKD